MNGTAEFELVYVFIYLVLRHVDVYFQARFKRSLLGDIDRPTFFFKLHLTILHLTAERERESTRGGYYFLNRTAIQTD